MLKKEDSSLRLPLLHKTASVPEEYVPEIEEVEDSIFCWKNPPEFIKYFWKKFFSSKEKITLIIINIVILMLLISASAFAVSEEETVIDKEILSVSIDYPIVSLLSHFILSSKESFFQTLF